MPDRNCLCGFLGDGSGSTWRYDDLALQLEKFGYQVSHLRPIVACSIHEGQVTAFLVAEILKAIPQHLIKS
jgi:hypothetical protein